MLEPRMALRGANYAADGQCSGQECLVASNHLVKFWEQSAPVTGQEEDGASTADSRGQCLLGVTYRLQKIPPRGTTNLFNKLY